MAVQNRNAQNRNAQNRNAQNGDGQNRDAQNRDVQTAIVLQGGGALGAYEYGVLRALYEERPGFTPVAVAGISIGAITAAVLGGARTDPMSALDRLWREDPSLYPPPPCHQVPPNKAPGHNRPRHPPPTPPQEARYQLQPWRPN